MHDFWGYIVNVKEMALPTLNQFSYNCVHSFAEQNISSKHIYMTLEIDIYDLQIWISEIEIKVNFQYHFNFKAK